MSLVCALAVGFGVTFALSAERGKASYAQTEDGAAESKEDNRTDEEVLEELGETLDIAPELLNFFSNSMGISPVDLEQTIDEHGDEAVEEMVEFLADYSSGIITTEDDIEDEDWYVAPDEVSDYYIGLGLAYIWSNYYTSKSGYAVTDEAWTNKNYAYGMCHRWSITSYAMGPNNAIEYMWVTLDPGEEYEYGLDSSCAYSSIDLIAWDAPTFFNSLLKGYWFTADSSGNYVGSDPSKTPLSQYEKDYATNITPTNNYISRRDGVGTNAGTYRAVISGDAPSGVYGLRFYNPFRNGSIFMTWGGGKYVTISGHGTTWSSSRYCEYVIIVKRNAPDKVVVEYDTGVDNTRLNKTSTFTGEALQIGVQGDWGAGLITFTQSYTPLEAGSTATSSLTTVYRAAAGRSSTSAHGGKKAEQETFYLSAVNTGTYTITMTPFNKWSDGSSDPVVLTFKIDKIVLEVPSVQAEDGVNGNKKFVHDNGQDQFISIFPILTDYVNYDKGVLGVWSFTNEGMITLYESNQGLYKITVSLKNNLNMIWDDGTVEDKEYFFEIGPMTIPISPEIIDDHVGVIDNTTLTKEVTYNGAYQFMSIMPVRTDQISYEWYCDNEAETDMTCVVADNVLRLTVINSGTYYIKLTAKDRYIFKGDNPEDPQPRIYKFIINKQPITAPVLMDTDVEVIDGIKTKTVTFYGETKDDGTEWFETLTFSNAYEARVNWKSLEMNQWRWGDNELILSARTAGTYTVYFICKDNYIWADSVAVQEDFNDRTVAVRLIIKPKPIALPYMINDGEEGAVYTTTQKTIDFDTHSHPFQLWVGAQGSVFISYNEILTRSWVGDNVTFEGTSSGTYNIVLTPTSNYCWNDGNESNDAKIFTFKITPIGLPQLEMQAYNYYQNKFETVTARDDADGLLTATARFSDDPDFSPQYIRIGGDPNGQYTAFDLDWHFFNIVDSSGSIIVGSEADYVKLNMTHEIKDGYLTISAVNAGTYYIRVSLNKADYCWNDTDEATSVVYKLVILPVDIAAPHIIEEESGSADATQQGSVADIVGTVMTAQYFANYYKMTVAVKSEYSALMGVEKVTQDTTMTVSDWQHGSNGLDFIVVTAMNAGKYSIKLTLDSPNFKLPDSAEYIEFMLEIVCAPVAGIEFHYYDKDGSDKTFSSNLTGGTSGTSAGTLTLGYNQDVQKVYVKHTFVDNYDYLDTGFDTQYKYEINSRAHDSSAFGSDAFVGMELFSSDSEKFEFSMLDAGTFTLTVTPTANYCWRDGDAHFDAQKNSVTFIVFIEKLKVPVLKIQEGEGVDNEHATKTVVFDRQNPKELAIVLGDYPDAYSAIGFENVNGGVEGVEDPLKNDDSTLIIAKALHTGRYRLRVGISNLNNYAWDSEVTDGVATYDLVITRAPVATPTVFLVGEGKEYNDSDRKQLTAPLFTESVIYDGSRHTLFVVGDEVSGGDIAIAAAALSPNGDALTYKGEQNIYVSPNGSEEAADGTRVFKFSAANVSVYELTVKFTSDDYYWSSGNGNEDYNDTGSRVFRLVISTKVVDVPVIEGYEYQGLENNSHSAYLKYNGDEQGINVKNVNYGPIVNDGPNKDKYLYMNAYVSSLATPDKTLFNVDAEKGTLSIKSDGIATVPTVYCVEISIDSANERWNTSVQSDTISKYFYMVIQKCGINVPVMGSNISTSSKTDDFNISVTYTGSRWDNAFYIDDVNLEQYSYTFATPSTMTAAVESITISEGLGSKDRLVVGTDANAAKYTVILTIKDKDNYEWNLDGGSIEDLNYNFTVNPRPIAKPVIYVDAGEGSGGVVGPVKTVTYNAGTQYLKIANYWNDAANRWLTVSSVLTPFDADSYSDRFFATANDLLVAEALRGQYMEGVNDGLLVYEAITAGKYVVRFTLTDNAVWYDGSTDPFDVTLVIEKMVFDTPYIHNDGDKDATIVGNTKTFSYSINEANGEKAVRKMSIVEYDDQIMELYKVNGELYDPNTYDADATGLTVLGVNADTGYFEFSATDAGTYTVEFRLLDFTNKRWAFADQETIEFTLEIKKMSIASPTAVLTFKLTHENIDGNTLTVQYDTYSHSLLLGGVRNSYFMLYNDVTDYVAAGTADADKLVVSNRYSTPPAGFKIGRASCRERV